MRWYQRFFSRGPTEKKLDAELRFHLEQQIADYIAAGISPEEARRRARLAFGGLDQMKEECRDVGAARFLENVLQDFRYSARRLRRSPGFTAAAVITLALGIGANALVFSVVNTVFVRPLSYRDANRLMWATEFFPNFNRSMVPAPEYAAWRKGNSTFERMEAMGPTFGANLTGSNRLPARVQLAHVTPGFFAMVGIAPRLGAGFDPKDSTAIQPVAIVSDALWRSYLQADRGAVGMSIALDSKPFTIVGVMPPGFFYPDGGDVAVWLPDAVPPETTLPVVGSDPVHAITIPERAARVIGKLKPGASPDQALADLERIARGMNDQYPPPWSGYHAAAKVRVLSLQKQLTADSETAAAVLSGAVAFLLLIACANVANLFLARAVTRRKEIAMRTAIGASKWDIVRMLVSESVLLGAMGGLIGISIPYWGRGAVKFLLPASLAGREILIDWRVLAFTAVISLAAGLFFGLTPALIASRVDIGTGLKENDLRWRGRLQTCLAIAQVALSLMLLAGAGLMVRSFLTMAATDPGFDSHNVLSATAMLRPVEAYSSDRQVEYFDRLLAGIRDLPGVMVAAGTSSPPMAPLSEIDSGMQPDDGPRFNDIVSICAVSANYFEALRIRRVSGRFFDARDGRKSAQVALVNQALTRELFHGRDPVGHHISGVTVVGEVADVRHRSLDDRSWPEMYVPFEQSPSPWITVLVRGTGDPAGLATPIRRVAQSIDASQPLFNVDLLEHKVSESAAERRERATLLGSFATLALLIAGVGIYGLMSYSVAQRTHEIGVRMALGAARSDVRRMVVGRGLYVAGLGMAIGLTGALSVTRVLKTFLYGVGPTDLTTFCAVCIVLGAAVFFASYLPARRASAIEPLAALRHE